MKLIIFPPRQAEVFTRAIPGAGMDAMTIQRLQVKAVQRRDLELELTAGEWADVQRIGGDWRSTAHKQAQAILEAEAFSPF